MKAIRLTRTEKGQRIPFNYMLLIFKKDQLPDYTTIGFTRYHVREYIPTPTRCVKCNAYGHVVKHCRGKESCSKCSGGHSYESCPNKENPMCINCKGPPIGDAQTTNWLPKSFSSLPMKESHMQLLLKNRN